MSKSYCGAVKTLNTSAIVVGGGIVGLTCAWRLARAGYRVSVFDPAPGRGATWAAAGMVAANAEVTPGEQSNFDLQRRAMPAWKFLASELFEVVGRHITISLTGTLLTGWDAGDRQLLEQFRRTATEFGVTYTDVRREDSSDIFVGLSDRIQRAILLDGDGWVDPDEVMGTILEGLSLLEVEIVRETVHHIEGDSRGVRVYGDSGSYVADVGILATGALGLPEGVPKDRVHTVRPVRGMTVRTQGIDRSSAPTLRCYVRGRPFYMVSRPGGYCVIGASSDEQSGASIEIGEMQRLLRDSLEVVPALETANLLETRVGLRPASSAHEPFFETWPERKWAWSSGHYRHGITLAPLTSFDALRFVQEMST